MQGNDQWTGFAIELLRHLSEMNHFDYVIKPVEDKKFGTFDETKGRWDGMIGELIYKVGCGSFSSHKQYVFKLVPMCIRVSIANLPLSRATLQ